MSSSAGITKEQLEQVLNQRDKSTEEKIEILTEKFDNFAEKTDLFRRKLLLMLSEMYQRQEITLDTHDKLRAFTEEWFGQD